MKITHYITNQEDLLGIIYFSERLNERVIVWKTPVISIELPIRILNVDTLEEQEKDIMEMVSEVLPR